MSMENTNLKDVQVNVLSDKKIDYEALKKLTLFSDINLSSHPSKQETFTQSWCYVGPAS